MTLQEMSLNVNVKCLSFISNSFPSRLDIKIAVITGLLGQIVMSAGHPEIKLTNAIRVSPPYGENVYHLNQHIYVCGVMNYEIT